MTSYPGRQASSYSLPKEAHLLFTLFSQSQAIGLSSVSVTVIFQEEITKCQWMAPLAGSAWNEGSHLVSVTDSLSNDTESDCRCMLQTDVYQSAEIGQVCWAVAQLTYIREALCLNVEWGKGSSNSPFVVFGAFAKKRFEIIELGSTCLGDASSRRFSGLLG